MIYLLFDLFFGSYSFSRRGSPKSNMIALALAFFAFGVRSYAQKKSETGEVSP
jgi:hypothetical protein